VEEIRELRKAITRKGKCTEEESEERESGKGSLSFSRRRKNTATPCQRSIQSLLFRYLLNFKTLRFITPSLSSPPTTTKLLIYFILKILNDSNISKYKFNIMLYFNCKLYFSFINNISYIFFIKGDKRLKVFNN